MRIRVDNHDVFPTVVVAGPRACGKTQRVVDMAACEICDGKSPVIVARHGSERQHVAERLTQRLVELGVQNARTIAQTTVFTALDHRMEARGFTGTRFREEDDEWT